MSVAGILAGSLFSAAGSQFAQQAPVSSIGSSGAPSAFAAVQQQLLQSIPTAPQGTTSIPSKLSQLGQDLNSGNLAAAQADYAALKIALAQRHTKLGSPSQLGSAAGAGSNSQAVTSGTVGQSGASLNPMAAAMQAYSSLQQNAAASGLSSSLITPLSTFSINA